MPRPTVSIVVAAYQAEHTIARAVSSALSQTAGDLEVVVVDDGSTDRTREVVEDLVERTGDRRIVLAPPSPNGGPSVARNRGLELARGDWVGFLDADDEYDPEFVSRMLRVTCREDRIDLVVCAHEIVQADGTRRVRMPSCGQLVVPGREAALIMLENDITPFLWDKLFRRTLLGNSPFPTGIHRGEDAVVVLRACLAASIVHVVGDALYIYHVSPTSLTWGRVAPIEETDRLAATLRDTAHPVLGGPRARRALEVSNALVYINSAHQAILRLPRGAAIRFTRSCSGRIPWVSAVRALWRHPFVGTAALLLKSVPGLYRSVYSRYIKRAYSING